MQPIPVEVMRLEELCPELVLAQLCRYILYVFPLDGRVSLEYGLDDVVRQVVLQPVRTVRLKVDKMTKLQQIEIVIGSKYAKDTMLTCGLMSDKNDPETPTSCDVFPSFRPSLLPPPPPPSLLLTAC